MPRLKLPAVNCQYGAPMGRRDDGHTDPDAPIKFRLRRVHLDAGGYDNGGAYWGTGRPLYMAEGETADDVITRFFRADDREDAKASLRVVWPLATFYR